MRIELLVGGLLIFMAGMAQAPRELPMPEIPSSLTDKGERVRYATDHYWDPLDFNDTTLSADPAFMGQNFANFALFLSYQPDSVAVAGSADNFFNKASVNDAAYAQARKTARQYLAGLESPVRNDETWLVFLDVLSRRSDLTDSDKTRYDYELEMARKNRIGREAADFEYELRGSGKTRSLRETPTGTKGLILMFYDPDCDHCQETIFEMNSSEELGKMLEAGEIAVLAIDAEEEKDAWLESNGELPKSWTVGYNTDSLIERDLYALSGMPTLYLLDASRRVIAKDVTFQKIMELLLGDKN